VISAAGGRPRRITHDRVRKRDPAWSPSGGEIAYVVSGLDTTTSLGGTYECGLIYLVRPDGTGRRRLSPRDAGDCDPAWSPDGTKLAFRRVDDTRGGDDLYVMTSNGSHPRRIAYRDNGFENFAWAPDSRRLAFTDFDPSDVYVFDLRSGHTSDITQRFNRVHGWLSGDAEWWSDGRQLVFDTASCATPPDPVLYVISADGSRWHRFQPRLDSCWEPLWLRGGKMLASSGPALYVFDLRRHTRRLVTCCAGITLAVAPDKTKIATDPGRALFVVGISGRGKRKLIQTPQFVDPG
jgi:Tol biopolymer transport system component